MRTLAATIGLLFAASAANAAQLDLIWTSSTGTGAGVGTSAITAATNDVLTLDIVLSLEAGESVSFAGVSVQFDNDGANELALTAVQEFDLKATFACTPLPTCFTAFGPELSNTTVGVTSSQDSSPGLGGFANTFEMGTLGTGPSGPISITMGTMTFQVNSALTDGADLVGGTLNLGFDGVFDNGGVELPIANTLAEVNGGGAVVPEPTTAALLALGLAGLGLAGRNRR